MYTQSQILSNCRLGSIPKNQRRACRRRQSVWNTTAYCLRQWWCSWWWRRPWTWRERHKQSPDHCHRWWYSSHCEYCQWFIVLLLVLRLYDKYLYHSPDRSRLSDPTSDQQQKVEAGIHVHRLQRLKISWSSKCTTKYLYTSTHPRQKCKKWRPWVWNRRCGNSFMINIYHHPCHFRIRFTAHKIVKTLASLTLLLDSWPWSSGSCAILCEAILLSKREGYPSKISFLFVIMPELP